MGKRLTRIKKNGRFCAAVKYGVYSMIKKRIFIEIREFLG
jgi:hypothetical protein